MSSQTPGVASRQADTGAGGSPGGGEITPVGVDVGIDNLAVAAPATASPDVDSARVIDGEELRQRIDILKSNTHALQAAPFDTTRGEVEAFAAAWRQIRSQLTAAAADVVCTAMGYSSPVLVLEDIPYPDVPGWEHRLSDPAAWVLPALQEALAAQAREVGMSLTYVDPKNTSQECHVCESQAQLGRKTIQCHTEECPVQQVCRDRSAAVSIASRALDE